MADGNPHLHDQSDPIDEQHVRGKFASRLGFMLAAVGSAVGLGNIWKFPYITGENGGAAFILIYLACIAVVALPALLVEFSLGRHGQTSAIGTYRKIAPGTPWWLNGLMGVLAGFIILSFYSAVAGWVLKYMIVGIVDGYGTYTKEASGSTFGAFIVQPVAPIVYQFIAMLLTSVIIYAGIEKGIERASKYLVPLLGVILILLVVRSVTLPGAEAGLAFMFKPDFSKLNATSFLNAVGLAFFTLSVGMGAMMTYASYVGKEVHLGKTALQVAVFDTGVAILSGIAIFPAVFAFDLEPSSGPGLIFITLPQIFAQMPMGRLVGIAFFFLIFIAALTSMISIMEPVVTWLVDDLNVRRHLATASAGVAIFLVGVPACLSVDDASVLGGIKIPFFGGSLKFFDLLDTVSQNFMLPLGALGACLFLLLAWKRGAAIAEVAGTGGNTNSGMLQLWYWCAVTITPLGILALLVHGVLGMIGKG
ncbi:MAG: neurotransmitter:Na+ symporter, family [Candidatus Sumerlaeota bacterium]|nr:neurotransmitter:Na+ symporter, family [Candidatus Sumerlaeota bacterium]